MGKVCHLNEQIETQYNKLDGQFHYEGLYGISFVFTVGI